MAAETNTAVEIVGAAAATEVEAAEVDGVNKEVQRVEGMELVNNKKRIFVEIYSLFCRIQGQRR